MSLKEDVKRHEGVVYGIYLDSLGKPTLGVGHLIDNSSPFQKSKAKQIKKLTSVFNEQFNKFKKENPKATEAQLIKAQDRIAKQVNSDIAGKKQVKGDKNVATFVTNDEFAISPDDVDNTFSSDFKIKGEERAKNNFPKFDQYPVGVQNALVSMSYQLGNSPKTWPSFNAALEYGLKTGDYSHAAYHASDSAWYRSQTPQRAREVVSEIGSISENPLSKSEMESYEGPVVPPQKQQLEEEKGIFDTIKDFFGMSAEASDVPPIESLEQPQEEVPMSPTDMMRARSQGRVVLDSHQSAPTNPEAGPSDTIPALLTEGEAVIPAAAAQNPENKEKIQELLVEGRVKNDMAEANGVPVTSQALAEIPKERLYDDVELDEYHRRNLTGKYGGGEQSLKGFAGGTMEVPALMMMIPPSPEKDPTMDAMEKLAVKQMAYEQKSKNRTRDTVEKIGLKHLEETATADMRQAALDETMKNYGLEVPAPMGAPPVQGFEKGSPVVTGDSLYSITQDLYQPEETRRQAEAMRREQFPDHIGEGERISVSDPRYKPPMPVDEEQIAKNRAANLGYDPRLAEQADAEIGAFAVPEQFKVEPASTISTEGTKGQEPTKPTTDKTEGGFLSGLGKAFGKAFMGAAKRVFAPEALAQGAIYYGVNKLLGYNDQTAAQQAMLGYGDAQKQIAADEKYLRDLGIKNLEVQRKRDEAANKNRGALYTFGEGVVSDTLSDLGVDNKDMNATKAFITQEALSRIDNLGLDMSTEAGLQSARDVMVAVTNNYATQVRQGFDNPNMSRAFDEVMLSKKAMSDAFTIQGDVPKVVSNKAVQGSLERIRRNVNADANIKDSVKQVEFENRVSRLYQLFRDNPGKVEALSLRAPSAGENEFTVFLEHILAGEQRGDTRKFNL